MTWYLPFKISIAKTDVFAIECLDQVSLQIHTYLVYDIAVCGAVGGGAGK